VVLWLTDIGGDLRFIPLVEVEGVGVARERNEEEVKMHAAGFQCAACGEWVETSVDESAGSKQQYVEDCQVCCQPNVLTVRWNSSAQEFTITAELES
jgi:cysteine-rich CPXCG protein